MPIAAQTHEEDAQTQEDESSPWTDLLPGGGDFEHWSNYSAQGVPGDKPKRPDAKMWDWDAEQGVIRYSGEGYGILLHDKPLGDFEMELDFRFIHCENATRVNSGLLVRMVPGEMLMHQLKLASKDPKEPAGTHFRGGMVDEDGTLHHFAQKRVTPKGWQIARAYGNPGRWSRFIKHRDEASKAWPEQDAPALPDPTPVPWESWSAWNTYHFTCLGGTITVAINGSPVCVLANAKAKALEGLVGLEGEGAPFKVRQLRVRALHPVDRE